MTRYWSLASGSDSPWRGGEGRGGEGVREGKGSVMEEALQLVQPHIEMTNIFNCAIAHGQIYHLLNPCTKLM